MRREAEVGGGLFQGKFLLKRFIEINPFAER